MPKKLPDFEIEAVPGHEYADLDSAWRAALPLFAKDLAATIRRLITEGYFIVKDGKIIKNPERMKENEL